MNISQLMCGSSILYLVSLTVVWNGTEEIHIFYIFSKYRYLLLFINFCTRAAVVYLNFRAGSTFQVPVCTVSLLH